MLKRAGLLALAAVIAAPMVLAAGGLQKKAAGASAPDLAVHEWGTFTSVAGQDGRAVPWTPLAGSSDLPCFVSLLNPDSPKIPVNWLPGLRATVRMETPVLYFYTPRETSVQVSVRFPQGLITEWYPQAIVPPVPLPVAVSEQTGSIDWRNVNVRPAARPDFPIEPGPSHYYAARNTDAASVRVGDQVEKFLFYRGLASFPVPIHVRQTGGSIAIENAGARVVPHAMLFESDGKRFGYQVTGAFEGEITLQRPALTGDLGSLRRTLTEMLVGEGLFPREAEAMVDTWRDSWFEPGMRVFYIVPRAAVDSILPLGITPRPTSVARVFVGRVEIVTPEMQTDIARAVERNDLMTLTKYGRFLEPAIEILEAKAASPAARAKLAAAFDAAERWLVSTEPTCQ
jgi:hypothetical protein